MSKTMKKIQIDLIKENPNNPRFITDSKFKKLVKSIKKFPQMLEKRPIVVDENMVVLGGNMRLKACKEVGLKEVWISIAKDWTDEQKREFVVKDNIGFGQWDWDLLGNEWADNQLEDWGLDIPDLIDVDDLDTDFELPDGDKEPFQQKTFVLSDEQAAIIDEKIKEIKKSEEYKYVETFGNENANGNALYLIFMQWAEQRK